LSSSSLSPQSLFAAQSFVQRHRLQLVHDPRARLHHLAPVPQGFQQCSFHFLNSDGTIYFLSSGALRAIHLDIQELCESEM